MRIGKSVWLGYSWKTYRIGQWSLNFLAMRTEAPDKIKVLYGG